MTTGDVKILYKPIQKHLSWFRSQWQLFHGSNGICDKDSDLSSYFEAFEKKYDVAEKTGSKQYMVSTSLKW